MSSWNAGCCLSPQIDGGCLTRETCSLLQRVVFEDPGFQQVGWCWRAWSASCSQALRLF